MSNKVFVAKNKYKTKTSSGKKSNKSSNLVESLQREALRIILSNLNYDQALVHTGLQTLLERRGQACDWFIQALSVSQSPCMSSLLPQRISVNHEYDLRSGTTRQYAYTNRLTLTDRFFTFKYK